MNMNVFQAEAESAGLMENLQPFEKQGELIKENEFGMWMMFYIGAANVFIALFINFFTVWNTYTTGTWIHFGVVWHVLAMMVGPVWMGALFPWATTGFQGEEFVPQEPMFSHMKGAADLFKWGAYAACLAPLLMLFGLFDDQTVVGEDGVEVVYSPNAWVVFVVIFNWLVIGASAVMMFLYYDSYAYWYQLMSLNVNKDFTKRWNRDYGNMLPPLPEDVKEHLNPEDVAPEEYDEKNSKMSQAEWEAQQEKNLDPINEGPILEPTNNEVFNDPGLKSTMNQDSFFQDIWNW